MKLGAAVSEAKHQNDYDQLRHRGHVDDTQQVRHYRQSRYERNEFRPSKAKKCIERGKLWID